MSIGSANNSVIRKLNVFRNTLHNFRDEVERFSIEFTLQNIKKVCLKTLLSQLRIEREDPFDRIKREVKKIQRAEDNYRVSILKQVSTFAGLGDECLTTAARCFISEYYKKGDVIIEQNEVGDSFHIVENGTLIVSIKHDPKDKLETPKEKNRLTRNSYFGEGALNQPGPRSNTITVLSDTAKCLRLRKAAFDAIMSSTLRIESEISKDICQTVINALTVFKVLTYSQKEKLWDYMNPLNYFTDNFLCRQGLTGDSFFIIAKGYCKMTINVEDGDEREVGHLKAGDYYGEDALTDYSNVRSHNVVAMESVSCYQLGRTEFTNFLKSIKATKLFFSSEAQKNDCRNSSFLSPNRRISCMNTHGQKDERRQRNILRRFAKFTSESLWNSLYHRMFREMTLRPWRSTEYGSEVHRIMQHQPLVRSEAIKRIIFTARMTFKSAAPEKRTEDDNLFMFGLLSQRNALRGGLCSHWSVPQLKNLATSMTIKFIPRFEQFTPFSPTEAYLVVRGCIRVFTRTDSNNSYFVEDLYSGDSLREDLLVNSSPKTLQLIAMTNVDLAVIQYDAFMNAQSEDTANQLNTSQRMQLFKDSSFFKQWESYLIERIVPALRQKQVSKRKVFRFYSPSKNATIGGASSDLPKQQKFDEEAVYFIINGSIGVVHPSAPSAVLATLSRHDYFGDAPLINRMVREVDSVSEEFLYIATTAVDVLVLQRNEFVLCAHASFSKIRLSFLAARKYRLERLVDIQKQEPALATRPSRPSSPSPPNLSRFASMKCDVQQLDDCNRADSPPLNAVAFVPRPKSPSSINAYTNTKASSVQANVLLKKKSFSPSTPPKLPTVLPTNRFMQLTSNRLFPVARSSFNTFSDASQSLKPADSGMVVTNSTEDTDRLAIRQLLDNLFADEDVGNMSAFESSASVQSKSSSKRSMLIQDLARNQSFQMESKSVSSPLIKLDLSKTSLNETRPTFRDSLYVKDSIDINVSLDDTLPPLQHWFVREKKMF